MISYYSFIPSDALINLLYANLAKDLSAEIRASMLHMTREQIRVGFVTTLNNIKINNGNELIVTRDCEVSPKMLKEFSQLNLHVSAQTDDSEFKLRFGEEIYSWFLRHQEDATAIGLVRDKTSNIIIRGT